MTTEQRAPTGYMIQLEGGAASGATIAFERPDDFARFQRAIEQRGGKAAIKVAPGEEPDTAGHGNLRDSSTAVVITLDDDTEGHAFAVHFPTREQADDLRRRLVLAGALAGTVAIGSIGLANLPAGTAAVPGAQTGPAVMDRWEAGAAAGTYGAASIQAGPMDVHEAPAFGGLSQADQAYADRLTGQAAAAANVGPMDVHEAPAFGGLSDADQAYADRLTGQATASQVGPMDVHEAPAFGGLSAADQAYADRLSGQVTVPAQIGPLDAHEAPAFLASEAASSGPMDRWEAGGSAGTLATSEAPSGVDDETGRPMGRGPLE